LIAIFGTHDVSFLEEARAGISSSPLHASRCGPNDEARIQQTRRRVVDADPARLSRFARVPHQRGASSKIGPFVHES
jgi:hypothetical protein